MTCRDFAEVLMEYVSDEWPSEPRQSIERHLKGCTTCSRYFASYTRAMTLAHRAFEQSQSDAGEDIPESLVRAILMAYRAST